LEGLGKEISQNLLALKKIEKLQRKERIQIIQRNYHKEEEAANDEEVDNIEHRLSKRSNEKKRTLLGFRKPLLFQKKSKVFLEFMY